MYMYIYVHVYTITLIFLDASVFMNSMTVNTPCVNDFAKLFTGIDRSVVYDILLG